MDKENEDVFLKAAKKILIKNFKFILLVILIIVGIATLIGGFDYLIDLEDGKYNPDKKSNVPGQAAKYRADVTIGDDKKIKAGKTATEVWNELIDNGSNIHNYLDNKEQLAKLMNAELASSFPDTREDVTKPINWDDVDLASGEIQGIIKFKRKSDDGKEKYMTYVTPDEFESLIEQYTDAESEKAKEELMSHFTLEKIPISTSTGGGIIQGNGIFTKFELTEDQLKGLAYLCQREQGNAKGAAAEASLIANRYDLYCKDKSKNLYDYVRDAGWWAHAKAFLNKKGPLEKGVLEAVRAVLVNGKRTLPQYVDEHDYLGDISSVTNNGANVNKKEKSLYQKDVSIIHNRFGGKYTFYSFPDISSDPFGYTSSKNREKYGDAYYDFDTGQLVNGNGTEAASEESSSNNEQESNQNNTATTSSINGQEIIKYARQFIGNKYVYGGTDLNNGIDCSGFVMRVYERFGVKLPRSSREQREDTKVTKNIGTDLSKALPGDIICYNGHVALYEGNGTIVHAANPRAGIVGNANPYKTRGAILAIKRVIGVNGNAGVEGDVTDSDTIGGLSAGVNYKYVVKVATWEEENTKITRSQEGGSSTTETETVVNCNEETIDYQQLVSGYTLPFNLLWSFLVAGEDKDFCLAWADLVYNSQIEITVHDNLQSITDTTKTVYYTSVIKGNERKPVKVTTTKVVTNKYITVTTDLTKADTWLTSNIVTYEKKNINPETEKNGDATDPGVGNVNQEIITEIDGTEYVKVEDDEDSKNDKIGDNFIKLYNQDEFRGFRENIDVWDKVLFDIIKEQDAATKNMLDLVKYLLQKATGRDYDVKDFNFEEYLKTAFKTVGGTGISTPGTATKEGWTIYGVSCPVYRQDNTRWASIPYSGTNVKQCGCGPCAFAMAVSGLTGSDVTPDIIVNKFKEKGIRTPSGGAAAGAKLVAQTYGLKTQTIGLNKQKIIEVLQAGNVIVCSTSCTRSGHFILIHGYDGNNFYVIDSYEVYKKNTPYPFTGNGVKGARSSGKGVFDWEFNQGLFVLGK